MILVEKENQNNVFAICNGVVAVADHEAPVIGTFELLDSQMPGFELPEDTYYFYYNTKIVIGNNCFVDWIESLGNLNISEIFTAAWSRIVTHVTVQ